GILRQCAERNLHSGPLVIAALHCQGLYHLHRKDYARAERTWQQVRALQRSGSPVLPRTLNHLARVRECRGQYGQARELYEEARRLQAETPQAFPATHFITLWALANLLDHQGLHATARTRLEEATAVVEQARLRTYGDAQQRAAFFFQFEPGFEQLVEWSLRA